VHKITKQIAQKTGTICARSRNRQADKTTLSSLSQWPKAAGWGPWLMLLFWQSLLPKRKYFDVFMETFYAC